MRRPHADGSPCAPIGICIPCGAGAHERCNDIISLVGCACVCNLEVDE